MKSAPLKPAFDPSSILGEVGRRVEIATPEGVVIDFKIASMGQRFGAFFLDLLIIIFSIVMMLLGLGVVFGASGLALGIVLWFLLVNFYFPFCEYRWGATVGKRVSGIRVIDRQGAPLALESVLARNLMRDLEFWIPVMVWMSGGAVFGALPPWASPASFLWVLALMFFPLFNRQRLRLGDFVGGTIVVEAPRPQLLQDLAQKKPKVASISFSAGQLAVYGRVELQVLEDLLRRPPRDARAVVRRVAAKVRKRIKWSSEGRVIDDRKFLEAFYRAQREELERLLALGKARETKEDGASRS